MAAVTDPKPTLDRRYRRAVIIRRHRLMLEAELRRLRMFPEDDERDDEERSAP